MPKPDDFRDLIGIPFVHGGRDPKSGLDCYGLVREAMRRFGAQLPDFTVSCYDALAINMKILDQSISQRWERTEGPVPSAVAVMALDVQYPFVCCHMGLCIGDGLVLHTLEKRNSSIFSTAGRTLEDRYFIKKIRGFYLWKG